MTCDIFRNDSISRTEEHQNVEKKYLKKKDWTA